MAARGYLGKISAVVSVNASSVGPTLSSTSKQITSWAKSTRSTIDGATSSANRSFNGMFTSLQKVQRALRDAQSDRLDLNFDRSARGILALREVAESLAKPIGDSARQFQTLSDTVQRQFYPALTSVQDAVSQMRQRIDSGVIDSRASFQALKDDVDQVVGAIGRLNETASLSGRLLTGRELTLVRPEVVDTLNRVTEAQKRLTAASASVRGSPIARDLVEDAQILQQQITRISARIERLNSQGLDIRVSQAGLDLALRRLREVAALTEEISRSEAEAAAAAAAPLIARARAEREFYEESRRLREQALADQRAEAEAAAAPIIARARAEQEAYEEGQRLRQQALADQRALAAEASQLLVVDQQESQVLSNQGASSRRATQLPRGYFEEGFARQVRGELGAAIDDPQRQVDALRGSIVSLKGQLDSLPAAVRTQFIPAIQDAEAAFVRIRAQPRATAEEIENAANEVDRLGQQLRRVAQSQAIPSFTDSLNDTGLRGALGNLNALQQVLTRVGARAGGDAAAQFDRMRAAIQRATRDGTIGTEAFQNELRQLSREAANAAAATGRISANAAFRQIQRGGDIARGGFDNVSLAVQQAAFAIDDFFSSTGDFTQRIRAVQNNVTQLAFILGGTTGLFIGLGAAITAQVGVAIYNWINAGRTAEDQTKALNDALARQKSLVEELRNAFESLADGIARSSLSERDLGLRELSKQIDDIQKKQRELREASAAQLDPAVQQARADRQVAERDLQQATTPQDALRAQLRIEAARRREQQAVEAAANRPAASIDDVRGGLARAAVREFFARTQGGATATQDDFERQAAQMRRSAALRPQDRDAVRQELQRRRDELVSSGINTDAVQASVNELNDLLSRFGTPVQAAIDSLVREIFTGASKTRASLEAAARQLEDVDFGPSALAAERERIGRELTAIADELSSSEVSEARARELRQQQEAVDKAAAANAKAIDSVSRLATAIDRFAGQIADSALQDAESRATQARRDANAALGRGQANIDAGLSGLPQADGENANFLAAASRQAEDDLRRARRRDAQFREQRNQAIQEFEANGAQDPNVGRLIEERARLQQTVESDAPLQERQRAADRLQFVLLELADAFEQSDVGQHLRRFSDVLDQENQQLVAAQQRRQRFAESAQRGQDLLLTPAERQRREVQGQLDDATNALTQGLADPLGLAAGFGGALDGPAADAAAKALEDGVLSIQELGDLFARFPEVRDVLDEDLTAAIGQLEAIRGNLLENSIASQLAENRANALLQGPSRAALNISDVSTMEGQRELNRLLRGDDPAKDVNLEEARKQNEKLDTVNDHLDKLRQIFAGIAG